VCNIFNAVCDKCDISRVLKFLVVTSLTGFYLFS
jgi:hypothetical protein